MTLFLHRDNPWIPFWFNLKQGYDAFELTKIPPDYAVDTGQYGPTYVFGNQTKIPTQTYGF